MKISRFALLFLTLTQSAYAEGIFDAANGLWGIGLTSRDSAYAGTSGETIFSPYIFGSFGPVAIEANRVSYSLFRDRELNFSLVGQLRSHQFREAADNPAFAALGDRDQAVEFGAQIDRQLVRGVFARIAYLGDISGTHEGGEWDLQLYRHDRFGQMLLLTTVGVQYQSRRLVDYYFGTPAYTPGTAKAFELELLATYPLGDWGLFAGTRSYFYDDVVENSPITDGSSIIQFFAGMGYYF